MVDENDVIDVVDENGKHITLNILFTYTDERTDTDYLFLYEEDNPDEIIVRKLTKDDVLEELSDEEYEDACLISRALEEEFEIEIPPQ